MNEIPDAGKVAIIDFQMGNLFSVFHACQHVGLEPSITSSASEIMCADGVILPGVGAFGDAAANIKQLGLDVVIKDYLASGRPFMGICLGLQILFSESEEFGSFKGLDIIKGCVRKFPRWTRDVCQIKVPHIGWNKILPYNAEIWNNTPLQGIESGEYMYFVHSFYVQPEDKSISLSVTNYEGIEYCSGILKDNLFACQFHPEKSAQAGLQIYRNWSGIIRKSKKGE